MEKYTCTHCKEEQTSATQAQETIVYYSYSLKTGDFERKDDDDEVIETIGLFCAGCGEELADDIAEKIQKHIYEN